MTTNTATSYESLKGKILPIDRMAGFSEISISFVDEIPGCKPLGRAKAIRINGNTRNLSLCVFESKRIGNCSNSGASSRHKSLTLVFDPANASEYDDDAIVLIHWEPVGSPMVKAIPLGILRRGQHSMAGGCYVDTSDSRFPFQYPVPLHDRVEY